MIPFIITEGLNLKGPFLLLILSVDNNKFNSPKRNARSICKKAGFGAITI